MRDLYVIRTDKGYVGAWDLSEVRDDLPAEFAWTYTDLDEASDVADEYNGQVINLRETK